jgi:hypothetical protein
MMSLHVLCIPFSAMKSGRNCSVVGSLVGGEASSVLQPGEKNEGRLPIGELFVSVVTAYWFSNCII